MTIRTRLSLWYAAVLFSALMLVSGLLYYKLVIEASSEIRQHYKQNVVPAIDPDAFEDVTKVAIWCGIPSALLALAGGWWLMHKSLSPIASLTKAAEKISSHNLNEQLPRTGNGDELDRLTEVFNSMLARLNDSFNRVHEFTLHASHELKTPLTVLYGEIETTLHDESILPSERARAISQLEELHRLTRIVEGLTFLSKADAGQITQEWDTLHLDELVKEAYADAQILAEPQNLRVELAFCEEVKIHGDRHRVRQLLLNLVDNAIKYNQPKGFVRMSLCCNKKNEAEFVIKNPGIGIDPEKLPRVFDRFFRGDPAHSQAVEGCGLGLSIAQHIVSAHGGTIKIESVPNQITTVTVCFTLNSKTKPT